MTPATRSGIPTIYRSTRFRSRLEARWAAFFDLIRWPWVYEPFDADGWIPDFLIQGNAPFLVEVGPCVTLEDYMTKAGKARRYRELPTLVVGVSPTASALARGAGLLVNDSPGVANLTPQWWMKCPSGFSIYGDSLDRPCGHANSGHRDLWDSSGLETLWRTAGNTVQWISRQPERVRTIMSRSAL